MKEEYTDIQETEVVLSDAATSILALLTQWKNGLPTVKISHKLELPEEEVTRELLGLEQYHLIECDHGGPIDYRRPPSEQNRVLLWKTTVEGASLLDQGALVL